MALKHKKEAMSIVSHQGTSFANDAETPLHTFQND